jgi:uncharacterized protein (AIM24 family)
MFGVARLVLAPGESAQISGDTLLASSYGVGIDRAGDTAFKHLAKSWKNAAVYTAPPAGGWADVSASLPGDLYVVDLDGSIGWCLAKDGWLAAASTVALDPNWSGFRPMFGGDVGFLAHAAGIGPLVLRCYGGVDLIKLAPNELVTVDPAHVLAYPENVQCRLRAISQTGAQSVRTGEGLALDFAGPGQLVAQTGSPRILSSWLASRTQER